MKSLKTAPQILEHYLLTKVNGITKGQKELVLKCMRMYARIKIEKEYEKLYQEARENILLQYNLK